MMCITSISNTQQTAVSRLAVIIATAIAMIAFAIILDKKGLRYLLAIATVLFFACGKDNGNGSGNDDDKSSSSNYELKREEIIGEWDIEKAKFDKAATMTDWDLGPTTFEFKENGFFEAKGYFGNGTGSFSIQGATITTVLENKPFIDFEIFGIKDKKVDVVATIRSSKA